MADRLRAAIAGTGFIGRVHARSIRVVGAELVGVAASTPERSAAAAESLRASKSFATAEELAVSDDVDVLHICTPNQLHAPLARLALEAGKHVVCEKPLAMTAQQAAELTAIAATSGLVNTVPFVYRFYPTVREARVRARGGTIGDLRLIHGSYLQDWLTGEDDYNWRVDPALGGASRAFADIGSHWCDLIEFVTGHRITSLVADAFTAVPERTVSDHAEAFGSGSGGGDRSTVTTEDGAAVLFRTDKGASGSVVISQVSPGRKNRLWFEVDGARGSVSFNQEEPETLWIGGVQNTSVLPRDAALMSDEAGAYAPLPGGHPQGYHDAFDAFVADTYEAIANGSPDGLPTFADGLRAARITDAVLESARTRGWVEVPA